jgi:hypothetical protein
MTLKQTLFFGMKIGMGVVLALILGWVALIFFPKKAEHASYFLPEGYIGPVIVVLYQSGGADKKYQGKARVYDIPETGILYSQFTANTGVFRDGDVHFYYRSKNGATAEIPYMFIWTSGAIEKLDGRRLQVVTARDAGFGTSINKKGGEFVYESFVIGPLTPDVAEALFRQASGLIDKAQKHAEGLKPRAD